MSKSANGQAKSGTYLLAFDLQNEAEGRAWAVTQRLASERKLKRTLLGFLLALDEVQRQTHKQYTVEEMMARFVVSLVMDRQPPLRDTGVPVLPPVGDFADDAPLIIGSANHADPEQARSQLALGMGSLFDDD